MDSTLFEALYFCLVAKANTHFAPSDSPVLCKFTQEISQCDAYRSFSVSNTIFHAKVENPSQKLQESNIKATNDFDRKLNRADFQTSIKIL